MLSIVHTVMMIRWFFQHTLLALLVVGCIAAVYGNEEEPLGQVAGIRLLSREEAAKGRPVKLKGTVVYRARGGRTFIVHDGMEGISVHLFRAKELDVWKGGRPRESENEVGALIEIEGVTGPAGYSPVIIPERFRRWVKGSCPSHGVSPWSV